MELAKCPVLHLCASLLRRVLRLQKAEGAIAKCVQGDTALKEAGAYVQKSEQKGPI